MFLLFIPLPLSFHDHNQVHATVFCKTLTDGYIVNPNDVWKTHKQTKLSRCEIFINLIQFSIELYRKQRRKLINSAVTHAN